jgi:hypothetical protein
VTEAWQEPTEDWDQFVGDAAQTLPYADGVYEVAPALLQQPFDPRLQERMRELVDPERTRRVNEAARRLAAPRGGQG